MVNREPVRSSGWEAGAQGSDPKLPARWKKVHWRAEKVMVSSGDNCPGFRSCRGDGQQAESPWPHRELSTLRTLRCFTT